MDKSVFHLHDAVSAEQLMSDFQHSVTRKIEKYGEQERFPQMSHYGVSQPELDDYLFDRQAIIDSEGTEKSRYTLAGILIVIPVVILAFFPQNELPWGGWSSVVGVGIGLLLFLLVWGVRRLTIVWRLRRLDQSNQQVQRYVDDVLAFRPS